MKPVAITGIGVISPYGYGVDKFWSGLTTGPVTFQNIPDSEYQYGAGIYGACDENWLPRGSTLLARANPLVRLGYWAAHQALKDANYKVKEGYQCALISGSAVGYSVVNQFGDMLEMNRAQYLYQSAVNGVISIEEKIRGMPLMLYSIETASTAAIALAAQMISEGRYQAVLVGGLEQYSRALHACYATTRKVSPLDTDQSEFSAPGINPWNDKANGFVFSEGAGYMLLEDLELAEQRAAPIHGLVCGWGMHQEANHDGYVLNPASKGISLVMDQALKRADISADALQTIIVSANGSPSKDHIELAAINHDLADHALTVTGFKHLLGETLGASGAFNTITACLYLSGDKKLPHIDTTNTLQGKLTFSNGTQTIGDNILISDLGFRGDSAALIVRRK